MKASWLTQMDGFTDFLKKIDTYAWGQSNMASYLVAITSEGGIPLLTRAKGSLPQLPFPALGSLNGVHMFAKNQNVKLVNTITQGDAKIVWKIFHDSVMLILVTSNDDSSDIHALSCLDLIFNTMVFHLGIDSVISPQNNEKLKRDLRVCYNLVDQILEGNNLCGSLTHAVDILLCQDVSVLQEYLDAFVEAINSEFGCLFVMGKIAVATARWWELSSTELILLSLLIHCQPECSSRDIPIFLPQGSPKVPHRLLSFQIIEGVEVCVICGPKPSIRDIEQKLLHNYWNPALDVVKQCLRSHPRNLTPNMMLDTGILGFILVNIEETKCLCSIYPGGIHAINTQANQDMTRSRRKTLLTSYYKSVVGTIFPSPFTTEHDNVPACDEVDMCHDAMETYQLSADHKTYAIRNETHQLFMLFNNNVPSHALRMLSLETLNTLTKDHLI